MRNNSNSNPMKSNLVNEKLCLIFLHSTLYQFLEYLDVGTREYLYKVLKNKWMMHWKMEDQLFCSKREFQSVIFFIFFFPSPNCRIKALSSSIQEKKCPCGLCHPGVIPSFLPEEQKSFRENKQMTCNTSVVKYIIFFCSNILTQYAEANSIFTLN